MSGASELMRAYMRANEGKSHEWGNLGTMHLPVDGMSEELKEHRNHRKRKN